VLSAGAQNSAKDSDHAGQFALSTVWPSAALFAANARSYSIERATSSRASSPYKPTDQIERRIDRQGDASSGDDAGVDDGGRPWNAVARKVIQEIERGDFFRPDGASTRGGWPTVKHAGGRQDQCARANRSDMHGVLPAQKCQSRRIGHFVAPSWPTAHDKYVARRQRVVAELGDDNETPGQADRSARPPQPFLGWGAFLRSVNV
jgi:hypothetical protein